MDLARQMKGSVADSFGWDDYEACLKETLDDKWDKMAENGYWMDTIFSPVSWDAAFKTRSGRFEFTGEQIKADLWSVVHAAAEGDGNTFPLVLVSYDSIRLAGGDFANPPFVTKTVADTVLTKKDIFIEINPETARQYQLAEGKTAILSTPKSRVTVRVHLSEIIMPGLVAMPTGLGHTAYDDFLAGKGANVNQLIGPIEDPVSGFDAAWGIRAKVAKA
jgi:anaerobic selenocysteine-containing dehydrogenase